MTITSKNWDSLDTLKLSPHTIKELKNMKEKSIDIETEFFNMMTKKMTTHFGKNSIHQNPLMDTGESILGREWGKKLGEFARNPLAKEIFCQEANRLTGVQET